MFTAKLCVEDKVIKKEAIERIEFRIREDHFIMNRSYNDYRSYSEEYEYEVTLDIE